MKSTTENKLNINHIAYKPGDDTRTTPRLVTGCTMRDTGEHCGPEIALVLLYQPTTRDTSRREEKKEEKDKESGAQGHQNMKK